MTGTFIASLFNFSFRAETQGRRRKNIQYNFALVILRSGSRAKVEQIWSIVMNWLCAHHIRIFYSHVQMRQWRAILHIFRDLDVVLAPIKRGRLVIDVLNRHGRLGHWYRQFVVPGYTIDQFAGLHN